MDNQTINLLLTYNEWQTFECKRALIKPSKLLETVVAFANTDGGTIVIGLEDPKKATGRKRLLGISEASENISEFKKLLDQNINPHLGNAKISELPIINIHNDHDSLVIVLIEKSNDVHSLSTGDTFVRKGDQNVKIGNQEIIRLKYEKGSIRFEDELSSVCDLAELAEELLAEYMTDNDSTSGNVWQFLKDNGLAHKKNNRYFLTKAGVLLFGKNPAILIKSKCSIKITRYYGTKRNYTGEPNIVNKPFSIEGPLLRQIEQSVDYFKTILQHSPPKLSGAKFTSQLIIPLWAFQEAVTNAVIHRNYSLQDDIQIRFFDDRIEIESPGTYPAHITPNNIRKERFARNPIIQRTLNRFRNSPNLDIGEGVDRMFEVMKSQNLYDPIYFPPTVAPNSVLLFLLNLVKVDYWDTVSKFLDDNYQITNAQARNITSIPDTIAMSRLLKKWVEQGLLEKIKTQFKGGTSYQKPGTTPLSHLQRD